MIHRIEDVLTKAQRESYHKLIGPPFDLSHASAGDLRTIASKIS